MKITEISKEYLEKGGLIRRNFWASNISIGPSDSKINLIIYKNSKPKEPVSFFGGMVQDIMADDWELFEKSPQVWKPGEGDKYYTIDSIGCAASCFYGDDEVDKLFIRIGNCFESKEDAEHMSKKLQIIAKLRELSNINFNEDLDEQKWYITYNHATETVEYDTTYHVQRMPFSIYFKNQEDCGNAIDTIGEDNLKKYYFDVEVEK